MSVSFLHSDSPNTVVELPVSACRILMSSSSLLYFAALDFLLVMLGAEDSDFSNIRVTFHPNSMPTVCGSLDETVLAARAMFRFECRFATAKFNHFQSTDFKNLSGHV